MNANAALSPPMLRLKQWMTLSTFLYAASGLTFAVLPDVVTDIVNFNTRILGLTDTPPSSERFWLTLACSMMMMLVVCCAMVARDVVGNLNVTKVVIISKFTSTGLGLLYFLLGAHHGGLLVVGETDLPLGIVTLVLFNAARKSA